MSQPIREMDKKAYIFSVCWAKGGLISALAVLLASCAHHGDFEMRRGEFARVFTPQVPSFMNGPAAVLLTNSTGFSARATVQGDPVFPQQTPIEGELLCRGSKLLFAPGNIETGEKDSQASGFIYLWDAASGSGYVMSEALQAYAPVSSPLRVTNLVQAPALSAAREITVIMNDGSTNLFRTDAHKNGIPTRINFVGSPPFSLSLTKIKMQAPAPNLFLVPDGFAKYASAEALADELAARQHNFRRGDHILPTSSGIPVIIRN